MGIEITKLLEAIGDQDKDTVRRIVSDEIWKLIDAMRERSEELVKLVRIEVSASNYALREADVDKESIEYQMGMWDGVVLLSQKLCQDMLGQKDITEVLRKNRVGAIKILRGILAYDDGTGIQHSLLAEKLKMSSNNLSNQMKYLASTDAVIITRLGRNTYYSLSPVGKKYVKRFEEKESDILRSPDVRELVDELYKTIHAGENERTRQSENIRVMSDAALPRHTPETHDRPEWRTRNEGRFDGVTLPYSWVVSSKDGGSLVRPGNWMSRKSKNTSVLREAGFGYDAAQESIMRLCSYYYPNDNRIKLNHSLQIS